MVSAFVSRAAAPLARLLFFLSPTHTALFYYTCAGTSRAPSTTSTTSSRRTRSSRAAHGVARRGVSRVYADAHSTSMRRHLRPRGGGGRREVGGDDELARACRWRAHSMCASVAPPCARDQGEAVHPLLGRAALPSSRRRSRINAPHAPAHRRRSNAGVHFRYRFGGVSLLGRLLRDDVGHFVSRGAAGAFVLF